mmetsp:Transcript_15991/g.55807  ORF Transcript_15991/g.55807 Transcript_15991/m.55807 type:complete len:254 (-) Transcript_15991:1638-2399(-)
MPPCAAAKSREDTATAPTTRGNSCDNATRSAAFSPQYAACAQKRHASSPSSQRGALLIAATSPITSSRTRSSFLTFPDGTASALVPTMMTRGASTSSVTSASVSRSQKRRYSTALPTSDVVARARASALLMERSTHTRYTQPLVDRNSWCVAWYVDWPAKSNHSSSSGASVGICAAASSSMSTTEAASAPWTSIVTAPDAASRATNSGCGSMSTPSVLGGSRSSTSRAAQDGNARTSTVLPTPSLPTTTTLLR